MGQILVVDDEEMLRNMIRDFLEIEGHKVLEAANGIEALESYRKDPSDVILIDIIMPEKEGIETIMEFRHINPDIKIIAMSGKGLDSPYLVMAKHLGANYILDKPFSQKELSGLINLLIDK